MSFTLFDSAAFVTQLIESSLNRYSIEPNPPSELLLRTEIPIPPEFLAEPSSSVGSVDELYGKPSANAGVRTRTLSEASLPPNKTFPKLTEQELGSKPRSGSPTAGSQPRMRLGRSSGQRSANSDSPRKPPKNTEKVIDRTLKPIATRH
jgi:hypothetical protein